MEYLRGEEWVIGARKVVGVEFESEPAKEDTFGLKFVGVLHKNRTLILPAIEETIPLQFLYLIGLIWELRLQLHKRDRGFNLREEGKV